MKVRATRYGGSGISTDTTRYGGISIQTPRNVIKFGSSSWEAYMAREGHYVSGVLCPIVVKGPGIHPNP